MNAARKRRLELKKRIETQRKQRDARDLEQAKKPFKDPGTYKCKHKVSLFDHCKICWEELGRRPDVMEGRLRAEFKLDRVRRAFVFLKMQTIYGPKIVSVWLSIHHPTQQIQDMRKNGFWAMDLGYLTWFAPDSFTEVCFDNEI